MKHSNIILIIGIWLIIVMIAGIPMGMKKILVILPALFLVAMGITAMRNEYKVKKEVIAQHDEIIQDIVEDIVSESEEIIDQEVKKLRDIL